MLAALLVAYLLGGSSGAEELINEFKLMEKSIKQVVAEENRRDAALEIIKAMIDNTKTYAKEHAASVKELSKTARDYEVDQSTIDEIIQEADKQTRAFQKSLLQQLDQLKANLTQTEWDLISPWQHE